MDKFNLREYLKNNPLLKENITPPIEDYLLGMFEEFSIGNENEYPAGTKMETSYQEIEKKFGNVSKIYIEAKRNTSQLKDDKAYWEALAKSIQDELEAKDALSNQLKEWIGQLESSKNQTQVAAVVGSTKVVELQSVVTDMAKSLEDLAEERDYLNAVNDTLKLQLSKAGHASVGAIGKKEGFKMSIASAALNWNKNYLGTSRPTLLKFRHREETHDHS